MTNDNDEEPDGEPTPKSFEIDDNLRQGYLRILEEPIPESIRALIERMKVQFGAEDDSSS